MDVITAASMDETYGTYVGDECFDIHDYDDDTDHGTHLEFKISIGAFDCLNITPVSLLGCSFVPKQGQESMIRHKSSSEI